MECYHYFPGTVPVLVNVPHAGVHVPPDILERFCPVAKQLPDTDWHVDKLYDFVRDMGVHLLVATHSRFVVDLNRPADDSSLYPGKFTTGICPTKLFNGNDIYIKGAAPDEMEVAERISTYWQPYHDQLRAVVDTIAAESEQMVLFDAHSICSRVPLLFDDVLPDLNIGTADGTTLDPVLQKALELIAQDSNYSSVSNGRFKGGFNTRHYADHEKGVQTVQLEIAQSNYMQESAPFYYQVDKAAQLQKLISAMINKIINHLSNA